MVYQPQNNSINLSHASISVIRTGKGSQSFIIHNIHSDRGEVMTRGDICCIGCKEYRAVEVKQQRSSAKSNPGLFCW